MGILLEEFDKDKEAVLNPWYTTHKMEDFPEYCVTTFNKRLIDAYVEKANGKLIGELTCTHGNSPIYEVNYKGNRVAIYLSWVGAPACIANFEEVVAIGAQKVVMFGSCGVLDNTIDAEKIIVPSSAMRDEGTSYHYIPANDEIETDREANMAIIQACEELGVPYLEGKTWTTDALYRETKKKMENRRNAGCITVDMECSAMNAVAKFRDIRFAQFFYAVDNLDAPVWESRGLGDHITIEKEEYMLLALESAIRM